MKILSVEATNSSNIGAYKNTPNVIPLAWHRIYKLEAASTKSDPASYTDVLNNFGTSLDVVFKVLFIKMLDKFPQIEQFVDSEEYTADEAEHNETLLYNQLYSTFKPLIVDHILKNPTEDPLIVDYIFKSPEFRRFKKYIQAVHKLDKAVV